ncbi:MAG: hypothetical protein FJ308_15740 [Planctomycetes bacterium]|nr:hypothetical protein [Planctomycetota bacterium]
MAFPDYPLPRSDYPLPRGMQIYCISIACFIGCTGALGTGYRCSGQSALEGSAQQSSTPIDAGQTRTTRDPKQLRQWLESMVWHHRYSRDEILGVTGLDPQSLDASLREFDIRPDNQPQPEVDPPIMVLPYPGGRHPRIGFLDGAIEPQRETKLSIFPPWDRTSYTVLDVPEAIWSNLGLTYLAHTHIDTVWSKQGIRLPQLEWEHHSDGSYRQHRELPNKIAHEVIATPHRDHLEVRMSLFNGTSATLSDLRVQMCAMLKSMRGFEDQTNDNKVFRGPLAACRNSAGDQWVILGFQKNHRTWGNAPCPCLHSDPIFDDCPSGETRSVHGWLSFYQGTEINAELDRIETIWRPTEEISVQGEILDEATDKPIAARLYVRSERGTWHFAESATANGQVIRYEKQNWINSNSNEFHSSISAHPFKLRLTPGRYQVTVERGKEYLPWTQEITVTADLKPLSIRLRRWIDMASRGWYSGDTHVHRPVRQIGIPMMAEDVNVALPMVYWTTRSELTAELGDRTDRDDSRLPAEIVSIDSTHVIWPKNTEWEIFSVHGKPHTLGALFAMNHKTPFNVGIPPVRKVLDQAHREGAFLDMDKHDWPFALTLPPLLGNQLTYELANNHMWRTEFAFSNWNTPAPPWMKLGDGKSGGEKEWIEFTHQTYWALLNCGLRLQPTAGTATGVHPVPIGFGRVYVHTPGGFNYDRWIDGLKLGNSFVTTGPMLFVRPNGDRIDATIEADGPVESVEWVINGVAQSATLTKNASSPHGSVILDSSIKSKFPATTWVALRAWQKSANGRWRFAHSAPVWFDVPDHPLRPTLDQQNFLVQRVEQELSRSRAILPRESLEEYQAAIQHYRELIPQPATK